MTGITKEIPDYGDSGERVQQQKIGMVSTMAAETQEERRGNIGKGNFNGFLLRGGGVVGSTGSLFLSCKGATNKEAARSYYRMRYHGTGNGILTSVSDTIFQW